MPDTSLVCDLHHSSWQRHILNPLSKARDRTCVLMDTSQICFCWAMTGTPKCNFIYAQNTYISTQVHNICKKKMFTEALLIITQNCKQPVYQQEKDELYIPTMESYPAMKKEWTTGIQRKNLKKTCWAKEATAVVNESDQEPWGGRFDPWSCSVG